MSRHGGAMARPVYLQQRTYLMTAGMAVECHKPTYAVQWLLAAYWITSDVLAATAGTVKLKIAPRGTFASAHNRPP